MPLQQQDKELSAIVAELFLVMRRQYDVSSLSVVGSSGHCCLSSKDHC